MTLDIIQDVSDLHTFEEVKARLAAIVESSQDAIIGKDLNGTITDWNEGAENLFGYTREEVIGQSIHIIAPPDSHHEIDAIMEKDRNGEQILSYETTRLTKNGERISVLLTVSPIKTSRGIITGASSIARNIAGLHSIDEY